MNCRPASNGKAARRFARPILGGVLTNSIFSSEMSDAPTLAHRTQPGEAVARSILRRHRYSTTRTFPRRAGSHPAQAASPCPQVELPKRSRAALRPGMRELTAKSPQRRRQKESESVSCSQPCARRRRSANIEYAGRAVIHRLRACQAGGDIGLARTARFHNTWVNPTHRPGQRVLPMVAACAILRVDFVESCCLFPPRLSA